MVYATHPINSFRAGFLWKHATIIFPFLAPAVIIFALKFTSMAEGSVGALLWGAAALVGLMIPHMFIRREHKRIMKEMDVNGSLVVEKDHMLWRGGDKEIRWETADISEVNIDQRLLHRFGFGEFGYAFYRLIISTKDGEKHQLLVSTRPLDTTSTELNQALKIFRHHLRKAR